jgi:uncharacterized Zn-binding protein involved in type VI secretion
MMRRVLIALTAVLAMSLYFTGGAQAICGGTCLNHRVRQLSSGLIKAEKKIASLSKTVSQQGQTIASQGQTIATQGTTISGLAQTTKFVKSLEECLFEAPFTQYGDPEGSFGYLFEEEGGGEIKTSALDISEEGSSILAWFIFDACNPQETLALNSVGGVFPAAKASSGLFSGVSQR